MGFFSGLKAGAKFTVGKPLGKFKAIPFLLKQSSFSKGYTAGVNYKYGKKSKIATGVFSLGGLVGAGVALYKEGYNSGKNNIIKNKTSIKRQVNHY